MNELHRCGFERGHVLSKESAEENMKMYVSTTVSTRSSPGMYRCHVLTTYIGACAVRGPNTLCNPNATYEMSVGVQNLDVESLRY